MGSAGNQRLLNGAICRGRPRDRFPNRKARCLITLGVTAVRVRAISVRQSSGCGMYQGAKPLHSAVYVRGLLLSVIAHTSRA